MKMHIVSNPERTRRAIVDGKLVKFFVRKPRKEHFSAFRQFWKTNCLSFEDALQRAEDYALRGIRPN